jgi:peptidoglycan/LPS O-acetylase OafA/YrhL
LECEEFGSPFGVAVRTGTYTMPNVRSRIDSVQSLRGIAAFVVMFYHFSVPAFGHGSFLDVVDLGKVGVASFFVISGFILPYSLSRSGYTSASYPTYLKKRLTRLEPPYLASILLIICFNFLTPLVPGYKAGPYHLSLVQLMLHFGYLIPFSHFSWFTDVYWTLAIEFQWYLLLGLVYGPLTSPKLRTRWAVFGMLVIVSSAPIILSAAGHPPSTRPRLFVFSYLFVFALGIASFQTRALLLSTRRFWFLSTFLAAMIWLVNGPEFAIAGGVTAIIIVRSAGTFHRYFLSLGTISYSLYLTHSLIGGRVMYLGMRYAHSAVSRTLLVMLALAISVSFAFIFWRLFEKPAQEWASRLRYGRANSAEAEPRLCTAPGPAVG